MLFPIHMVRADVVESIVAIVNSSIITKIDMDRFREKLRKGSIVDDLFGNDQAVLLKDDKVLLKQMIDEKVVDDEVKKQNLTVTIERVEQEINSIQAKNRISRDYLKAALKKGGTSFSEYQAFIKKRLERQSVIERAVTSKIKISEEDVAAAYEAKYKHLSATSFEYRVAHILFREGKRKDEEQQSRAREVYQKLKVGGDFDSLAAQFSEDPGFNEGGLLGTFRLGETLKPLEDAFKTLAPGEFSQPTKSKLGWHIVKLLDRRVVSDPEFEKRRDELRGDLYQRAFVKQFQFWLDQKRQESFIRIN
ncbi:MAG: peptidylprolyl isomerase [Oligoflexia bacterium]|nr:peptidylprolyl isomerase [Oligoflexia bacterium]